MGSRMATNLLNDGHQLVVHDRSISAMEAICQAGGEDATSAYSPEDVASEEGTHACEYVRRRDAIGLPRAFHNSCLLA